MKIMSQIWSFNLFIALLSLAACRSASTGRVKDATTDQISASLPQGIAYQQVPSDGIERFMRAYDGKGSVPPTFAGIWWQSKGKGNINNLVFSIRNAVWSPNTRTLLVTSHSPYAYASPSSTTVSERTLVYFPGNSTLNVDRISGYQISFAEDMKSAVLQETSYKTDLPMPTLQVVGENSKLSYVSDSEWQRSFADGSTARIRRLIKPDGTRDTAYGDYLADFGAEARMAIPALVLSPDRPVTLAPNTSAPGTAILLSSSLLKIATPDLRIGSWCQSECFSYCKNITSSTDPEGMAEENGQKCRAITDSSNGFYLLQADANFPVSIAESPRVNKSYASGGNRALFSLGDVEDVVGYLRATGGVTGPAQVTVRGLPTAILTPSAVSKVSITIPPGEVETLLKIIINYYDQRDSKLGIDYTFDLKVEASAAVDLRLYDTSHEEKFYDANLAQHVRRLRNRQVAILANRGTTPVDVQVSILRDIKSCAKANKDGKTCDDLHLGESREGCIWGQKWKCTDGCGDWQGVCSPTAD